MTKAQLRKKFRTIKKRSAIGIDRFFDAALKSGAFDLPSKPDDYALAKNILVAALCDEADQWMPFGKRTHDHKEIRNISRMTYPERSNIP